MTGRTSDEQRALQETLNRCMAFDIDLLANAVWDAAGRFHMGRYARFVDAAQAHEWRYLGITENGLHRLWRIPSTSQSLVVALGWSLHWLSSFRARSTGGV